jgi:hypothetical protein
MINITEKEFKQLDLEFRQRASRLCRATLQEVKMLLSQFLNFIEHTAILKDYIQSCTPNMSDGAIREMMEKVIKTHGRPSFDFGNGKEEETARQYRILQYAAEPEDFSLILQIGHAFNYDSKLQASVESFMHVLVSPFVDNLTLFLHSVAMEVCASPEKNITFNFPGNSGQINIAQDNASLRATQEIKQADWQAVAEALRIARVAEADIQELKTILEQEHPESKESFSPRIKGWIAKIVGKVAEGIVHLPFETAAGILATMICQYRGLA